MDKFVLDGMLLAKTASQSSVCKRRKVGAVINDYKTYYIGYNRGELPCAECTKAIGICPSIHAEQDAILTSLSRRASFHGASMFLWSEVPCAQCLSFISRCGNISLVYCLTPESYSSIYSSIDMSSIRYRLEYAERLGIIVVELDMHKILEEITHDLSRCSSTEHEQFCSSKLSGLAVK